MTSGTRHAEAPQGSDLFANTRWTVVLSAGRKSSADSDRALADLCRAYWYPLYAYVRRQGVSREDAEDLTQAFFAKFLQRNYLAELAAERGKFRAFLLACLKHFLANEWDKARRQKRGGLAEHLSLDWELADRRYEIAGPAEAEPDQLYDRAWAIALLERVVARLREECAASGKSEFFERAKAFIAGPEDTGGQDTAAAAIGMEPGAFRVALHRMRKHYREMLISEIEQTLADPAMAKEELKALQAALRR